MINEVYLNYLKEKDYEINENGGNITISKPLQVNKEEKTKGLFKIFKDKNACKNNK